MKTRRSFFRMLLGGTVAAAAAPLIPKKPDIMADVVEMVKHLQADKLNGPYELHVPAHHEWLYSGWYDTSGAFQEGYELRCSYCGTKYLEEDEVRCDSCGAPL